MKTLADALKFVLRWEGGLSNDPDDAGHLTNMGITQGTYNAYRQSKGLPSEPVRDISRSVVEAIYEERYWKPSRAMYLTWPLSLVVMDTAVNFGVGRSNQFIGECLGLKSSTAWQTAASKLIHDASPKDLARKICQRRMRYRHERVAKSPSQKKFLKGWLNRDQALLREVEKA